MKKLLAASLGLIAFGVTTVAGSLFLKRNLSSPNLYSLTQYKNGMVYMDEYAPNPLNLKKETENNPSYTCRTLFDADGDGKVNSILKCNDLHYLPTNYSKKTDDFCNQNHRPEILRRSEWGDIQEFLEADSLFQGKTDLKRRKPVEINSRFIRWGDL